jgi:hypothetical protein
MRAACFIGLKLAVLVNFPPVHEKLGDARLKTIAENASYIAGRPLLIAPCSDYIEPE